MVYHSTTRKIEKNASNNWTHQMCNPIENTSQEGYVSSYESTKCDCRVDMTTRNVRPHSNRHKKPKCMRQWCNYETARSCRSIAGKFACHNTQQLVTKQAIASYNSHSAGHPITTTIESNRKIIVRMTFKVIFFIGKTLRWVESRKLNQDKSEIQ